MERPMIPPGFRFCPTEGEVVVHYLTRKNNNQPLPCDIVKEVALYKHDDPDQLTAMNESVMGENNEWYFFTKREKRHGRRADRTTRAGFWKASSGKKPITYRGEEVGSKMHLVFWYRNTAGKEVKTNWLMTEFSGTNKKSGDDDKFDSFVLCKVYNHKDPKVVTSTQPRTGCNHSNTLPTGPHAPFASSSSMSEYVPNESTVNQCNKTVTGNQPPRCYWEGNGKQLVHSENGENSHQGFTGMENPVVQQNNMVTDDYPYENLIVTDDYGEELFEIGNHMVGDIPLWRKS